MVFTLIFMLTEFKYNGNLITRREDGMFNLTQMCKANGKELNDWHKLKGTKAYLEALSTETKIPVSGLIEVKKGGNDKTAQGSWGNSMVAIELARWLSPKFAVWCNAHIFNLLNKGKTSLDIDPLAEVRAELCNIRADILNNNDSWDDDEKYYLPWS